MGTRVRDGTARTCPSPYGDENFLARSAGACPPRVLDLRENRQPRLFPRPRHGEGQALALREGAAFFSPQREGCHCDVERFMKHPHLIFLLLFLEEAFHLHRQLRI